MGILQDFANAQEVNEALKKGLAAHEGVGALEADISKVKEDLDRVSDNFDKFFEFEMGIFSPGTTNNIYVENKSTNRMRTPVFTVNKDTTIRLIDGTRKVVVCVQDDESGTNYEQLPTLSIDNKEMSIVANNRFYRVMIMNADFSDITDEEEIAKSVVYLYKDENVNCAIKALHTEISKIETQISNQIENIMPIAISDLTKNGVSFTSDGQGVYVLNGTATSDAVYMICNNITTLPSGVENDKRYTIIREGTADIYLSVGWYDVNGTITPLLTKVTTTETEFTTPSEAVGLQIKFYAKSGLNYDNAEVTFKMYDTEKYKENRSYSPLYKKSVAFNGDSICYGVGYLGGYGKIIADTYNMEYENIAVGGATIIQGLLKSDGVTPRHSVSATIANMNSKADYIIIEGGVNDANEQRPLGTITDGFNEELDVSTYYGAFEYMLKELVTRFSGKKIGYIAVHKWVSGYDSRYTENSYYYAAKECCKKWGVPVCDLNTLVPPLSLIDSLKTAYIASSVHPNEEGYRKYYVPKIIAFMERL